MMVWRRIEPLLLLFAAGGFIGLIFPLAKLAGQLGVSPLTYTGLSAAGAALGLVFLRFCSRWHRSLLLQSSMCWASSARGCGAVLALPSALRACC